MDERIRESSGLKWNPQNVKLVRKQLDQIIVAIKTGTFRYANVFPKSSKRDHFSEKERSIYSDPVSPDQVNCLDYINLWFDLRIKNGRVTGRTLWANKSLLRLYLKPYFGEMTFADLNSCVFEHFIAWARKRCYRKKTVSNETINKCFNLLSKISKDAAIEYEWDSGYNPFFGFIKLPVKDSYEKIFPFSLEEQEKLIAELQKRWRPYFMFAFRSGLRQGEQFAIKPEDIDWGNKMLYIRRAMTRDENGKRIEGSTKNKYSRRTIKLNQSMFDALIAQKEIYNQFKGKYFFCSPKGHLVHQGNLRNRVWLPALKRAELEIREMKQTRHTFTTIALGAGENPLWIANVLGHRNTRMIVNVYSKYVENANGSKDGNILDSLYQEKKGTKSNNE